MGLNRSTLSFDDIREAFDKALEAPKGIKIRCQNRQSAISLRSRFNYFRKLNREQNKEVYTPEHILWNNSVYDKLLLRIPPKGSPDEFILYIEPYSIENFDIEEIS